LAACCLLVWFNLVVVGNRFFGLDTLREVMAMALVALLVATAANGARRATGTLTSAVVLMSLIALPLGGTLVIARRALLYQRYSGMSLASPGGYPQPGRRNLLLITIDTLRRDALSTYGSANATPNIDRLARRSLVFWDAYSTSNHTWPAMTGLFTSIPPSRLADGRWTYRIPRDVSLLADDLHHDHYATGAVIANQGLIDNPAGLVLGFDAVLGIHHRNGSLRSGRFHLRVPGTTFPLSLFVPPPPLPDTTAFVAEKSVDFLNRTQGSFFFWAHFMDPHDPYYPPARLGAAGLPVPGLDALDNAWYDEVRLGRRYVSRGSKSKLRESYMAEVRYVDEAIGRVLDALERSGHARNTIVVLTADHGEEFWDHGDFGHGQSFRDVLVNVPLLMSHPDLISGVTVRTPVSHLDVMPTLYSWLGLPPQRSHTGRTLSLDLAQALLPETPTISEEGAYCPNKVAVVHRGHKLVYDFVEDTWAVIGEDTYHRYAEPSPEELTELLALARRHAARGRAVPGGFGVGGIDSEEERRFNEVLRSLGYL
jgi:arylsulfatase